MRRVLRKIYNKLKHVNVIMIHHVCDDEPIIPSCIISKEGFKGYVKDKRFVAVNTALKSIAKYSGSYVLTVDDALDDLYTEIYPVCKANGIPFTAFISIDLIDKDGYITTDQLVEMSKDPLVTIGSHGCTHIKLNECDYDQARYEIMESKRKLERIIGKEIFAYAYSNGVASKRDIKLVKKAGYRYGFGVIPRKCNVISLMFDRFLLPRYNLDNNTVQKI